VKKKKSLSGGDQSIKTLQAAKNRNQRKRKKRIRKSRKRSKTTGALFATIQKRKWGRKVLPLQRQIFTSQQSISHPFLIGKTLVPRRDGNLLLKR